MKHTHFSLFVLFLFVVTLGCGGGQRAIKTEFIEGTITYNGTPVGGASINFFPVNTGVGNPAYGFTNASGIYRIQTALGAPDRGTTPGEYVVTVSKSEGFRTGRFITDEEGNRLEEYDTRSVLPEIYGDPTTSPFRATVVSGRNTFDFDLVDNP